MPQEQVESDYDALEAYAKRLLEAEGAAGAAPGVAPGTGAAPTQDRVQGTTVTQAHMQQIPDRTQDRIEDDLLEAARRELRGRW